jgi:hypothetical protein
MKAWPPPKSLLKVAEKFSLMTLKASSNLTRETSSISLMEAWVFSMDSMRSLALGFEEGVALGGLGVLLEGHHVDRAHSFEALLEGARGFFFGDEGFGFDADDGSVVFAEHDGLDG